jgi:hypothetical protein
MLDTRQVITGHSDRSTDSTEVENRKQILLGFLLNLNLIIIIKFLLLLGFKQENIQTQNILPDISFLIKTLCTTG